MNSTICDEPRARTARMGDYKVRDGNEPAEKLEARNQVEDRMVLCGVGFSEES